MGWKKKASASVIGIEISSICFLAKRLIDFAARGYWSTNALVVVA